MLRFANTLHQHYSELGYTVSITHPVTMFGKLVSRNSKFYKWIAYIDKFIIYPPILAIRALFYDIIHICDHSNSMYIFTLVKPHLQTCNDLIAVKSSLNKFSENPIGIFGKQLQKLIIFSLKRAKRITCISEATRRDFIQIIKNRTNNISVTYMGQNYPYRTLDKKNLLNIYDKISSELTPEVKVLLQKYLFKEKKNIVIHVGGNQWYKNRVNVLKIFHKILQQNSNSILIMAGQVFTQEMKTVCIDKNIKKNVLEIIDPSNILLEFLYNISDLLLFPSLQEGFGWPIIEAQACGIIILTSNRPPMNEIGGESVFYANPENHIEFANKALEIFQLSSEERETLIQKGIQNANRFSTDRMISEYLNLYKKCIQEQK
jgi:glycosyltransferase involved in cell wall biosynthesis